jgi:hypothetical protein
MATLTAMTSVIVSMLYTSLVICSKVTVCYEDDIMAPYFAPANEEEGDALMP